MAVDFPKLVGRAIALSFLAILPAAALSAASPIDARMAGLQLHVPVRPDLGNVRLLDTINVVSMQICNREGRNLELVRALCGGIEAPLVNNFGVRVFVSEPHSDTEFRLISELPEGADAPPPDPLTEVQPDDFSLKVRGGGEWYELSRVRMNVGEENVFLTTKSGWPIASCVTHPIGTRGCKIGFLLQGAFVEASWFAEESSELNQAEVWQVATALRQKLLALSH